ncbi:MAG: ppkA [Acidobacteria bacterium]|nr:ppkA [Acidobacteriota bacterium]
MTPDQWEEIKRLLDEALARPVAERAAFVAGAGLADAELAREFESLVAAHDEAGRFMATPALAGTDVAALVDQVHRTSRWAGRRVGAYRLVREIGFGGMGAVYLGVRADSAYEKEVAIKVVRSTFEPAVIERRFRAERQILAALDHPNIARLIDGGATDDGSPYFAMEYVDGLAIDRYCETNRSSLTARLELFCRVCAAVNYAHQRLVVHRDLKASNILVTADGVPKLLDFGIAKLLGADVAAPQHRTVTAMRVMTLESASPEQVRGEAVTTATDVYALGVLLHRLLAGRGPYPSDTTTSHDLARAICDHDPGRPSDAAIDVRMGRRLKGDLDTIILKALQKDPQRRYGTVGQFADDITRYLTGRPVIARPDTVRYRASKFIRRHKASAAAAAIVAGSLAAGALATMRGAYVADVQRARAEHRFNEVRRLANSFLFEFHDAIEHLPGSTRARELVVRRATEYLDSLATESAHDPSLERELAAAYDKVGDLQGLPATSNLGDTAGALRNHRSAAALRDAAAAAVPTDESIQRELKTTFEHLSAIHGAMGDAAAAGDYQRKGLAIAQALYVNHPLGVAERRSLAAAYHNAGDITAGLGDWPATLDNFRREVDLFETLLASEPASARAQRDVAVAYKKLGAILEKMGDRTAALANYRKAVALDEVRARASTTDRIAHLDLSYGYASIGYALSTAGDVAGSLANYEQALSWRQRAAASDPHDVNAQDAVVRAHLSIGRVLRDARRLQESIQHFRSAIEIATSRYVSDPSNRVAAERLASIYAAVAPAYAGTAAAATDRDEALRYWQDTRVAAKKSIDIIGTGSTPGPLAAVSGAELRTLAELAATSDREIARLGRKARR